MLPHSTFTVATPSSTSPGRCRTPLAEAVAATSAQGCPTELLQPQADGDSKAGFLEYFQHPRRGR